MYICTLQKVQSFVGESADQSNDIEKQVLNLYDRLYQSYVLANSTTLDSGHTPLSDSGDLFNEVTTVVMDNLETVTSVSQASLISLSQHQQY